MRFIIFNTEICGRLFRLMLLCALISCGSALTARAQDDDTLHTETALVQLNVGVVDRQGRSVKSLSRNDFVVYEDGVRQTIQSFEPTEAPFSLVVLLDMSGSTSTFRPQLQFAARRFLDALGPDDRVSIIAFNAKVKTLTHFTT